jgi:hypothetical protein
MESLREIFFKTDRIHSFDIHQFLFRLNGLLFRPAAGLTPETRTLTPETSGSLQHVVRKMLLRA